MDHNIKYALGEARYMIKGGIYEIFSDKKYASIYMFSIENVRGVVSSLDVRNKEILTVSASGDHIFNMLNIFIIFGVLCLTNMEVIDYTPQAYSFLIVILKILIYNVMII